MNAAPPRPQRPKKPRAVLLVAEKPIMARDIAAALLDPKTREDVPAGGVVGWVGENLRLLVTWAEGHLVEMLQPDEIDPKWASPWRFEALPVTPPGGGIPTRVKPGMERRVQCILNWMQKSDEVVNACDAGREGELIFDEIVRMGNMSQDGSARPQFSRMWITDTRPDALRGAFEDRARSDLQRFRRLRESAWARAEIDYLWGINHTRYATLALAKPPALPLLAVGRVQTPLLAEISERDKEIATFTPERFERVPMAFRGESGNVFEAQLVAFPEIRFGNVDYHFHPGPEVREIQNQLLVTQSTPWKVMDMPEPREEFPPAPFDLLDLQRCAFRLFGWSATKTLRVAQTLYAREKAITYPRTDSCKVPLGMREDVSATRETLYYEWGNERFPDLKGAILPFEEDAHFVEGGADHYAILPTGAIPQAWAQDHSMRDEYRLWELIAVRTILAWLPPAKVSYVKRLLMREWEGGGMIRAFVEAEPVDDPGWLWWEDKMMNTRGIGPALQDRMRESALPDSGPVAIMQRLSIKQGETSPPKHYNEETALGWMQRNKLGTAATRAEVIEELLGRGYLVRTDAGTLRVTHAGAMMIGLLVGRLGESFVGCAFPRQIEETLERIEGSARERPSRERVLEMIMSKVRANGALLFEKAADLTEAFCPKTGHRVTLSENGKYYKFVGYPDAKCWLVLKGRDMKPGEWALVFAGGDRGGGPFNKFKSNTGTEFDAYLIWRPRKKKFDFDFKR